jgi:hypothetical protein
MRRRNVGQEKAVRNEYRSGPKKEMGGERKEECNEWENLEERKRSEDNT